MARRASDFRTREFVEMNRHSFPGRPVRTKSSRPSSLVLGPFVQLGLEAPERYRMSHLQPTQFPDKSHEDGRPLTDIELYQSYGENRENEGHYPAAWKLASITVALCMAIFLVALVSALLFEVLL